MKRVFITTDLGNLLLGGLLAVARADGIVKPEEMDSLRSTASELGVTMPAEEDLLLAEDCRKLVLHDWMVKAGETREWKMFLTDTPENQAGNVADRVMEKTPTGWVALKNENNADLRRLFDTGVDVDGPTTLISRKTKTGSCRVKDRSYPCTTKVTRGTVKGVPVTVTCRTSRELLWTNIGCQFVRTADGGNVFGMGVVDVGRVRLGEVPEPWSRVTGASGRR
jgi:hypothetical protein